MANAPRRRPRSAQPARYTLIATLLALVLGASAELRAQTQSDDLQPDILAAAKAFQPIPLGGGLVFDGAEAREGALRIRLQVPEELGTRVDALKGALLSVVCGNEAALALMKKGANVEIALMSPSGTVHSVDPLKPVACGVIATSRTSTAGDPKTRAMLKQHGLAGALERVAASLRPATLGDNIQVVSLQAEGRELHLGLRVTQDENEAAQFREVTPLICSEPTFRTLLRAGAKIDYQLIAPKRGERIFVAEKNCTSG